MLYDGIIFDSRKKSITSRFTQPEMPLYAMSSGQITQNSEVLAFGVVHRNTISRAVRFDESAKRFESLFTILNKANDFEKLMTAIERKRSSLLDFSKHPRPVEDGVQVEVRPTQITNSGDEYSGEWSMTGIKHGFGVCIIVAASCLYEGYWKDD